LAAPFPIGAPFVCPGGVAGQGRLRFDPGDATGSRDRLAGWPQGPRRPWVTAEAAIGHSLGEITALHWAGVLSEEALLRIARVRGAAMADLGSPTGGMLAIAASAGNVQALLNSDAVTIVWLQLAAPDGGGW